MYTIGMQKVQAISLYQYFKICAICTKIVLKKIHLNSVKIHFSSLTDENILDDSYYIVSNTFPRERNPGNVLLTKAELLLEGIFFALNFLPWEFLLVK